MSQRFATTRWSLILTARQGASPEAREALASLYRLYWYPLYAFVRRQHPNPQDAYDLTQSFFTYLMEKNQLAVVDRQRGRFRSWLLSALQHFLSNERDRERAQKRGGGRELLSLDAASSEERYRLEPAHDLTPERLFERHWALALLEHVLATLREECVRNGKALLFDRLKSTLTGEPSEASYQEIAHELGSSVGAVKVAAHRLRRRYRELLREEISQTVEHPEDVDDELKTLLSALS